MDDADDTDPGLAGLSPEFQAMIGGMAGHTAQFQKLLEKRVKVADNAAKKKDDEVYIESYAQLDIHEDMLKDHPRVEAYRAALDHYAPDWRRRGNVSVVDVGSGTGLLAVLSARSGALRVHAVEASRLAYFCKQIAEANVPTGEILVHETLAEDLDLGEEKVDVIVSEWMGYFLLFENMLPSVFAVRDKYLKPGGLMLPSKCRLLLAPMQDRAWRNSKIDFWRNAAGVDMSALVPLATSTVCEKPAHRLVPAEAIIGPTVEILNLDLHEAKDSDLKRFRADLGFDLLVGSSLDGFVTWFECDFGEAGMLLSTAPGEPPTHWRQTAFQLREPISSLSPVRVEGTVEVERHESYSRGYRVTFDLQVPGKKSRLESFELR